MLAEEDYSAPFDYQDLLVNCPTARECVIQAESFLEQTLAQYRDRRQVQRPDRLAAVQLATELKGLRLGEYIAENEADQLQNYFVETSAYKLALQGRSGIFVGRKGTGKTANLIHLASALQADKRNLVVVIQPVGYDLAGLTRLLKKYRERDTKGYVVDSLWKFLIYSELAHAAALDIEQRPGGGPYTSAEDELLKMFRLPGSPLRDDFSVRLERALESLNPLPEDEGIEETRLAISEALHGSVLGQLRRLLGDLLFRRERVAVLVDNLDKAWSRDGDLEYLSELMLGLFSVAGTIPNEFSRPDRSRKPVNLTLTVFLRSDIFSYVIGNARERDKISFSRILWNDRETLLRILDERLVASQGTTVGPDELWQRFFMPNVASVPVREYLVSRIQPRPRDILYLTATAIEIAINRGHSRIEESDILEAEKQYSQYALDTIETEATATLSDPKSVLYEFIGANEILEHNELEGLMPKAGVPSEQFQNTIDYLTGCGFLGLEIRYGEFNFAADENDLEKNTVLGRKLLESEGRQPRYKINVPFQSFLEVQRKMR